MDNSVRPSALFSFTMLFAYLLVAIVIGVSFSGAPEINNGDTTYTYNNLVCSWTPSADTTNTTVTWFKNGVLFSNTTFSGSLTNSTVGYGNTTREEAWRCSVTLANGSSETTEGANVTIENSAPLSPEVYDGSTAITAMNITEDSTFSLDMNSSDADNDTLTYYFLEPKFCTVTDSATGAVSCTATHDYVNESSTNQTETPHEVIVEFWVRDAPPNTKSSSRLVTFNITPVNDIPDINISDQQTNVTEIFNQTFVATDEEEDYPLNATLDASSTDPLIRDDVTVSVEGDSTVRIVYQTSPVEYGDAGNRTVVFNLTDSRGKSKTVSFTLEILSQNQPPHFTNITPDSWNSSLNYTYNLFQNDNITLNLSANDNDTSDRNETITFTDNSSMLDTLTLNGSATAISDARGRTIISPGPYDIGNHTILLFINDTSGATTNRTLFINVKNINDDPIIFNNSYNLNNSANNVNIYNLTAYRLAPFYYAINYTDYDLLYGDTLSWSDNSTLFNVTQDGIISFTPASSGNQSINITVVDSNGASTSVLFILEIVNNTPPYFNQSFPELRCPEGSPCFLNLSYYAKDDDSGNNISTYTASNTSAPLSSFALYEHQGYINFTPLQSEIGVYHYTITAYDVPGASAVQELNITVIDANDTPRWDSSVDFSNETIVVDHEFTHMLIAYDEDLLLPNSSESLSFTSNLSWVNITPGSKNGEQETAVLSFTPNSSQTGTHTIQLNVTDATGLINTTNVTFTVLPDSAAPTIDDIKPYGGANGTLINAWLDVSSSFENNLTISENQSVLFEANGSDAETSQPLLIWKWYYDGALVKSGSGTSYKQYNKNFSFNSSGQHNLSLTLIDETLNTDTFTWLLNVENVNRPPILAGNLSNLNVSSDVTYQNYFRMLSLSNPRGFYDSDDDLDGDGLIDNNETQNLNYSATSCTYASLSFSGDDLIVSPQSVGTCYVLFNATDSDGASVVSNMVSINVLEVPEGAESTIVSSGGGGGGSSSTSTLVPFETEVETPYPLSLITPKLVTIYKNKSVKVPIELRNNWTAPLKRIALSAKTNATGVSFSFDTDYVEELPVNATEKVTLTVTGYRLGEDFEAVLSANVSDPRFSDSAEILFNSIEQSQEGKNVEMKVTFARDLLSQHKECQELGELLQKASKQLQEGNVNGAGEMVDTVINGCQYLISRTGVVQQPGFLRTPWLAISDSTLTFVSFILLGIFLIVSILGIFYFHHKAKEEYNF